LRGLINDRRGNVRILRLPSLRSADLHARLDKRQVLSNDLSVPDRGLQLTPGARSKQWELLLNHRTGSDGDGRQTASVTADDRARLRRRARVRRNRRAPYSPLFRPPLARSSIFRRSTKHGVSCLITSRSERGRPGTGDEAQGHCVIDAYQSKENAKHVIRSIRRTRRASGTARPVRLG